VGIDIFEVGSMVKKVPKKVEEEPLWKKSDKDPDVRHKFLWLMLTLIIIVIIAITIFIVTMPPARKVVYSDLRLDSIQTRRISDDYVDENTTSTDLEVTVYLTNDGLIDSGQVRIEAYMKSYNTRGEEVPCDATDIENLSIIPLDKTSKTTFHFNDLIIKKDQKYTIEFIILEDDKIVEIAKTTIKVPYVAVESEPDVDFSENADDDAPGREKEEEEDMGAPGFEIVPLIIALSGILFVIKNKNRHRK
jgi:hypothetical protein